MAEARLIGYRCLSPPGECRMDRRRTNAPGIRVVSPVENNVGLLKPYDCVIGSRICIVTDANGVAFFAPDVTMAGKPGPPVQWESNF